MATKKKIVYRSNATGKKITKKQALKLGVDAYTVEKMAARGHRPAKTRTVYRVVATGALITKAAARKLDKSLYTVEEQPASGHAPTKWRLVYRNTATGALISKEQALALAAAAYSVTQEPIPAGHPTLFGLDVELTGNWGTNPKVTADPGSNDKRGTIRITPGIGVEGAPGWILTFKRAFRYGRFAMVSCQKSSLNCPSAVTATALSVVEEGVKSPGTELVYDYIVSE